MRFSQQNSRSTGAHPGVQRRRSDSLAWTRARYPLPLFQSGRHTNIQDPGFRFAPPRAEVYYAFGVFPRLLPPENALIAECFLR
jgi:hypothetical protein